MARKIRKKVKKKGAIETVRWVRLSQKVAMELMTLGRGGDLTAAERHLRMVRPELDDHVVHEVCFRCADPGTTGGVRTGEDPKIGPYADIAITK